VYQQADIFVLPSISESCGLALLEAMSCGLPVVVTKVGGMVEHVQDEINGIVVPPRDPHALAAAIRRLAHDPELRRRMGQANSVRISQHYTWDAVADAYMRQYEKARAGRTLVETGTDTPEPAPHAKPDDLERSCASAS
jgi:glycosyltransferase involved in cell wall biosynthesis